MNDADAETARALAESNLEYERRFGHIYLVCASGRTGAQLLSLLRRRLRNDGAGGVAGRSIGVAEDQRGQAAEAAGWRTVSVITTHVLDTALGRPAVGSAGTARARHRVRLHRARPGEHRCRRPGGPAQHGSDRAGYLPAGLRHRRLCTDLAETPRSAMLPSSLRWQLPSAVRDLARDYHVPLLLSPFGYATYRGS